MMKKIFLRSLLASAVMLGSFSSVQASDSYWESMFGDWSRGGSMQAVSVQAVPVRVLSPLEQEIADLRAFPPSRTNNQKIARLEQQLQLQLPAGVGSSSSVSVAPGGGEGVSSQAGLDEINTGQLLVPSTPTGIIQFVRSDTSQQVSDSSPESLGRFVPLGYPVMRSLSSKTVTKSENGRIISHHSQQQGQVESYCMDPSSGQICLVKATFQNGGGQNQESMMPGLFPSLMSAFNPSTPTSSSRMSSSSSSRGFYRVGARVESVLDQALSPSSSGSSLPVTPALSPLEQEIADLRALPSSRFNNQRIANLERQLQEQNSRQS